ncbi:hypothetical protein [Pontiella desulfatans]|uniref:hypothetical protein n=1 Tax=Pontiella desulfatans TaxID=2750659 RepID=UPI00109C1162|nr:hypothetical protein [Pontiella desulfatans]
MSETLLAVIADIGSICSIIGLLLTLGVLFSVRHITRHFVFKARVPQLLKAVGKHAKDLNSLLVNAKVFSDNRNQVHVVLSESEITIAHLLPRLQKDIRKRTKLTGKGIRKIKRQINTASHSDIYEIYSALRALESDLKNEIENSNWSYNHA